MKYLCSLLFFSLILSSFKPTHAFIDSIINANERLSQIPLYEALMQGLTSVTKAGFAKLIDALGGTVTFKNAFRLYFNNSCTNGCSTCCTCSDNNEVLFLAPEDMTIDSLLYYFNVYNMHSTLALSGAVAIYELQRNIPMVWPIPSPTITEVSIDDRTYMQVLNQLNNDYSALSNYQQFVLEGNVGYEIDDLIGWHPFFVLPGENHEIEVKRTATTSENLDTITFGKGTWIVLSAIYRVAGTNTCFPPGYVTIDGWQSYLPSEMGKDGRIGSIFNDNVEPYFS